MTTQQVETATVVGTITLTGNATVTVTAYGMGNSPKAISVAVSDTDTASIVGGLIRTALAFDTDVAAMFLVSGSGANVVLTKHVATANDSTLNIAIANGTCTGLTAAPTSTNTTAGDGLNNGYCTLAEMKSKYLLDLSVATYDTMIEKTINAVSRKIDNHCGRHFYQTTETRYFTPDRGISNRIPIDDVYTTSGFLLYTDDGQDGTYENTWATTDYSLLPTNATTKSLPYTSIEVKTLGAYRFPYGRASVKVTASFGWSAIPDPVQVACLMHTNRLIKRFLTPIGESATSALGTMKLSIPAFDPDILNLLEDYVRLEE